MREAAIICRKSAICFLLEGMLVDAVKAIIRVNSKDAKSSMLAVDYLERRLSKVSELERYSDNKGTQDAGAILAIILGSAFLVEIAKGIADLIRRDRSAAVEVVRSDGTKVIISGISCKTAEDVFQELQTLFDDG